VSPEHLFEDNLSWEIPEAEQRHPSKMISGEECDKQYTKETTMPLLTIPKFNDETIP